jgi:uncharacterized protein
MVTQAKIDDFLSQRTLAIVGVSRAGNKFGNSAYKELIEKGYKVYIVHPSGEVIDGAQSYKCLGELPEQVGGVVVVVPPGQAEKVVQEAHALGIRRIWLQPGAESTEIIEYGEHNGMSVVSGVCILMFAEPQKFFHKPHKWVMKLLGRLPR